MAIQAYDAIIATIVVATDATTVVKTMTKNTHWREGTSGDWSWANCTLQPGKTYQFRTVLSYMTNSTTAILPNIKADITIDWDVSANPISSVGNYFMYAYAYNCNNLRTLGAPDTTGLISVGLNFMAMYAYNCSGLDSLNVPDTSGLKNIGNSFMASYARDCSNIISLDAPNIMNIENAGNICMDRYAANCTKLRSLNAPYVENVKKAANSFLDSYALNCTTLHSLGVPYLPNLNDIGVSFMSNYASGCDSLEILKLPSKPGYFENNNVDWYVPSSRLGSLIGEVYYPSETAAWQELTISGKTLYTNYIRSADFVVSTYIENWNGAYFDHMLYDRNKFDREINDNWEGYVFGKSSMETNIIIETPLGPFRFSGGNHTFKSAFNYILELIFDPNPSGKGIGGIKEGKLEMVCQLMSFIYSNGNIEDFVIGDLKLKIIDLRDMILDPNSTVTIDTDSMTVLFNLDHDVSSITNDSVFFELDKGLNDLTISWEYADGVPNPIPADQLDVTVIWQNRYL